MRVDGQNPVIGGTAVERTDLQIQPEPIESAQGSSGQSVFEGSAAQEPISSGEAAARQADFDAVKAAIAAGTNANNCPYGVTLAGFDFDHYKDVLSRYPPEEVAKNPELIDQTGKALVLAYLVQNKVEANANWAPRAADELNRLYNTNKFQAMDGETLAWGDESVHSAPGPGYGMQQGTFNPNARGTLFWGATGNGEPYVGRHGERIEPALKRYPPGFTLSFSNWSAWGVDLSHTFGSKHQTKEEADNPRSKFMEAWARLRRPGSKGPTVADLERIALALGRSDPSVRMVGGALHLGNAGVVTVGSDGRGGSAFSLAPPPSPLLSFAKGLRISG